MLAVLKIIFSVIFILKNLCRFMNVLAGLMLWCQGLRTHDVCQIRGQIHFKYLEQDWLWNWQKVKDYVSCNLKWCELFVNRLGILWSKMTVWIHFTNHLSYKEESKMINCSIILFMSIKDLKYKNLKIRYKIIFNKITTFFT